MPDVRLIDANKLLEELKQLEAEATNKYYQQGLQDAITHFFPRIIEKQPTIDAQHVKIGKWFECYRDSRCISVICSVCRNPTSIAHGFRDANEVTMEKVIEKLPYCPKCCADMREVLENG